VDLLLAGGAAMLQVVPSWLSWRRATCKNEWLYVTEKYLYLIEGYLM
jgi:hypothetical protein